VLHEIIEEGVNGVFVEENNSNLLAEKLKYFIAQKNSFDNASIAAVAAEKYNFKNVGHLFTELYNNVLISSK
jgi:glycosyltransferase involved in cell wall biosynthesis